MTMMRSPDWWNSGELTGDWGGPRNTLYDDGVSIFANYTNNIAGNPVGGKRAGGTNRIPNALVLGAQMGVIF